MISYKQYLDSRVIGAESKLQLTAKAYYFEIISC